MQPILSTAKMLFFALLMMGSLSSVAQIDVATNFRVGAAIPVDTRDTLTTLADTANITAGLRYPGLLTYVRSVDQYWHVKADGFFYQLETGGGAGVTDGDKGDITVSSSGSQWAIDEQVVTWQKIDQTVRDIITEIPYTKGETSAIPDGAGDITITHGLGRTPQTIQLTAKGTTFFHLQYHELSAVNFKVRVFDATGAIVTNQNITLSWRAE